MAQGYTGAHNSQFQTSPTGTAGGDLSGTYPNPLVAFINGVAIAADPFTQYTKLAGRTGTTNDTILNSAGTAVGTLSGSSQSGGKLILQGSTNASSTQVIDIASNVTAMGSNTFVGMSLNPSLTFDTVGSVLRGITVGVDEGGRKTWLLTASPTVTSIGFQVGPNVFNSPSGTSRTLAGVTAFTSNTVFNSAGAAATLTITDSRSFDDAASCNTDGTGSSITITAHTSVYSQPNLGGAAGSTITTRRGLWYRDNADAGVGKQPTTIAVDVDNQSSAAAFTEVTALKSAIVSGTGKFFLRDTGGAQSSFAGKVTTYNAIATVEQGLVPEYAEANLTAQATNKGQTTLYAVPASGAGLYRVSGYVVVTQQATTSSTMPKIQIDWTDSDSNTAVGPFDMTLSSTAVNPTVGSNSAGQNLLTTDTGTTAGTMVISARQSTSISYRTTGYASVGVTAMQYAVHVRLEAL